MNKYLWSAACVILLCALEMNAGDLTEHSITVDGVERDYLLYVPSSCSPDQPAPLVFVFHGGGGNARQTVRFTQFNPLADREGFLVVYPNGLHRSWNDGRHSPRIRSQLEGVDDIEFVRQMLSEIERAYRIDPRRIYATGLSNGGFFSHRIGVELSDKFAAIAPVISSLGEPIARQFDPVEPISVLMMNGTDDPLVPFAGGEVSVHGRGRGRTIDTCEAALKWAAHDGCNLKPEWKELADKAPDDGARVVLQQFTGGRGGTEVFLYTILGGGHTWPGAAQYLPKRLIGPVCRDLDATLVIWEFFERHPKR